MFEGPKALFDGVFRDIEIWVHRIKPLIKRGSDPDQKRRKNRRKVLLTQLLK